MAARFCEGSAVRARGRGVKRGGPASCFIDQDSDAIVALSPVFAWSCYPRDDMVFGKNGI